MITATMKLLQMSLSVVLLKQKRSNCLLVGLFDGSRQEHSFIRRSMRSEYIKAAKGELSYLVDITDDKLFDSILSNPNHVLHCLLQDRPPARTYNPSAHDVMTASSARVLLISLTLILSSDNYYSRVVIRPNFVTVFCYCVYYLLLHICICRTCGPFDNFLNKRIW